MLKIDNFPDDLKDEMKDEAYVGKTTLTDITIEAVRRELARRRTERQAAEQ